MEKEGVNSVEAEGGHCTAGKGRCWGRIQHTQGSWCMPDNKLCQEPGALHRAGINLLLACCELPSDGVRWWGGRRGQRQLTASSPSTASSWVTSSSSSWLPTTARNSPPPARPPGRRWSVWWPTRWPTSTTEPPGILPAWRRSRGILLGFCWALITK